MKSRSARPSASASTFKQRGVALLMVLMVAALVSIIAVAMIARTRTSISRTLQLTAAAQARAYAMGAETFAREVLAADFRGKRTPPRVDRLSDAWAKPTAPFDVDCGALQLRILDAQQGFNINSLAQAGTGPALTRFRGLLGALELDGELADRAKDWVDADQDSTGSGGEDGEYLLREPAYRAANVPMADVSELDLIASLDRDGRARLHDAVDALPVPRTKINVNTVGPYAFMALAPQLSLAEATNITRGDRDFSDPAQFVNAFPMFGPAVDALAVSSDYFSVRVRVDCNDATVHLDSLVFRDPSTGATRVLRRNFGRIWFNSDGRSLKKQRDEARMTAGLTLWLRDHEDWQFAEGDSCGVGLAALRRWRDTRRSDGAPPALQLLLPAERVLATRVTVPARSRRQYARGLPFAVEEKLAIDLDNVHIATGALRPDEPARVRVVERDYLDGALAFARDLLRAEALEAAPEVGSVKMDAECLPVQGDIALLVDGDRVLLHDREGHALACARDVLPLVLGALCRGLRGEAREPLRARAWVRADRPLSGIEHSALLTELSVGDTAGALEVEPVLDGVSVLVAGADGDNTIELLQGRYAPRREFGLDWKPWRPAAIAALVLLCMQPMLDAGRAWRLGREATRLEGETQAMYRSLFPGESMPTDIRRAFESRVGKENDEAQGVRTLLSALADALSHVSGFELQSLTYDRARDELAVQVQAGNLSALEGFKVGFARHRLVADVGSAEQEADHVRARLRIHQPDDKQGPRREEGKDAGKDAGGAR